MLMRFLSLVFIGVVAACSALPSNDSAGTVTTAQKVVNATAETCKDNDAAIVAADKAVVAGVLKGNDARNALRGLTAIQTACASTLAGLQAATAAANPASAASGASK